MPCLRGVEVSLTTRPEDEQIPEYPHPDGTSARILADWELANVPSLSSNSTSNYSKTHAVRPKAGPTVSVYIPSIPGTLFAINYRINTVPPAPCKFVFFRLYINARPIAAWGIDPEARPRGKVVKSLWAPCPQYPGQVGFEGRNFVFLPGEEHKSVAEDGGLIEIQVFRARERRARAPKLQEFRYQENYGIASPSIGLLDRPQDAHFYDWHLLDAKDSPFVFFRFHYRSWKNLEQLNLIPDSELELLREASPKALKNSAISEFDFGGLNDGPADQSSQSESSNEDIFQGCLPHRGVTTDHEEPHFFLKSPPELFPVSSSGPRVPQPSKALRDGYRESYLQRPLPELPSEAPPGLSRRSSVASSMSITPSITPSLLRYVEEGPLDDPNEIEVGVAQLVRLPPSESTLSFIDEPSLLSRPNLAMSPDGYSISDYETSPRSTNDSSSFSDLPTAPSHNNTPTTTTALKKNPPFSPSRYLPMTGSALERGLRALFTPPKPKPKPTPRPSAAATLRRSEQSSGLSVFHAELESERYFSSRFSSSRSSLSRVTMTESEWMSRSPSPVTGGGVHGLGEVKGGGGGEGGGGDDGGGGGGDGREGDGGGGGKSLFSSLRSKKMLRGSSPGKVGGLVLGREGVRPIGKENTFGG